MVINFRDFYYQNFISIIYKNKLLIMKSFIELSTGDFISLEDILYVHLAKTSECAYIYVKNLCHSSDEQSEGSSKRITISLEDYDKLRAVLSNWTQRPVTLND